MPGLRILAYNDLEAAFDNPDTIGRLAGLISTLRDERTIVCGAGDNTALGTVALLSEEGRGLARQFFERVAPETETFGNHDLDEGRQYAFDWAESVPPTYCGANIAGPGADSVPLRTVIERTDEQVGVIGVTHPETADVCGSIRELTFEDPIEAVRREARTLRNEDVEHIVVLSHGGEYDREIASRTDVDAVIGGHVHRQRCTSIDGTTLVRTAGGGRELAEVSLRPEPTATVHQTSDAALDETAESAYRRHRDGG